MNKPFKDRSEAGRALAGRLAAYSGQSDVLVLGLARGGVPVAFEVARTLQAPLDVFVVRKLGVPGHEELAMGAIASGDVRILNKRVLRELDITDGAVAAAAAQEEAELLRRERTYRGDDLPADPEGKTVILVDDGLATGSTMRAAVAAMRGRDATRVVVGVPTASPPAAKHIAEVVDEIVTVVTPEPFFAVGMWYEDFSQTTDEEVKELLAARPSMGGPGMAILSRSGYISMGGRHDE